MSEEVPVTEARAQFSELVNRVGFGKERIILTRHGRPLVALIPAEDLDDLDDLVDLADAPAAVPAVPLRASVRGPEPRPHYLDVAARATTSPPTRLRDD